MILREIIPGYASDCDVAFFSKRMSFFFMSQVFFHSALTEEQLDVEPGQHLQTCWILVTKYQDDETEVLPRNFFVMVNCAFSSFLQRSDVVFENFVLLEERRIVEDVHVYLLLQKEAKTGANMLKC